MARARAPPVAPARPVWASRRATVDEAVTWSVSLVVGARAPPSNRPHLPRASPGSHDPGSADAGQAPTTRPFGSRATTLDSSLKGLPPALAPAAFNVERGGR